MKATTTEQTENTENPTCTEILRESSNPSKRKSILINSKQQHQIQHT